MKKLLLAFAAWAYLCCAVNAQAPSIATFGGGITNPTVLTGPQSYSGGGSQPVGLDQQGGLIPATGLRTAAVTCSSACTTFGSGSNGVLFTLSTWPYSTVDVDVTSVGAGTTITYEASNDNPTNCASSTNWLAIRGVSATLTNIGQGSTSTSGNAAGHYVFTTVAACFRARVSIYGSGTITAGAYQTNQSAPPLTVVSSPLTYPQGATAITTSASGTTASGSATLAGTSGKVTYICSYRIMATATTALASADTITGTITGTLNLVQPIGASPALGQVGDTFNPCIPASATNTGIVINAQAPGTGGVWAIYASGYQF